MESIFIYSEYDEPFGLLSNNAKIKITLSDIVPKQKPLQQKIDPVGKKVGRLEKKGGLNVHFNPNVLKSRNLQSEIALPIMQDDYESVTHYVYTQCCFDDYSRNKMRAFLYLDPLPNLLKIRQKYFAHQFQNLIETGTDYKYAQHSQLRNRLSQSRGSKLIIKGDDEIIRKAVEKSLERARNDPSIFYDPIHGEIPAQEIFNIMYNVKLELRKNLKFGIIQISPEKFVSYSELKSRPDMNRLARKNENELLLKLSSVDDIIIAMRQLVETEIYKSKLVNFDSVLLNAALLFTLEKEYPNVERKDYPLAITQQRQKTSATKLSELAHELLILFENGKLPQDLIELIRPDDIPVKPIEYTPIARKQQEEIIDEKDDFQPNAMVAIDVNNFTFKSVLHYVWWHMLKQFNVEIPNLNDFPIEQLTAIFHENAKLQLERVAIRANELATAKKFQISSLRQLLLTTNSKTLVWNDPTDSILGQEYNASGKYLEAIRQSIKPSLKLLSSFNPLSSNLVIAFFCTRRMEFYNTIIEMLENPTSEMLANLFNVSLKEYPVTFSANFDVLAKRCKLTDEKKKIIVPLISSEFFSLMTIDEKSVTTYLVEQYHFSQPSQDTRDRAINRVERMKSFLKSDVSIELFINKFFAFENKQTSTWRINKWGKI